METVFGKGGGTKLADELNTQLLGEFFLRATILESERFLHRQYINQMIV